MRVLWFTNTSSLYKCNTNIKGEGGGWIESLENLLSSHPEIDLGICFINDEKLTRYKILIENTTYYPIRTINRKNYLARLIYNLSSNVGNEKDILPKLLDVINDYKPDIINVFGTEKLFGLVQRKTTIPVVIHLQGLLNPILNYSLPFGSTINSFIFSKSFLLSNFIGTSPYFHLIKTKKAAKRELEIFEISKVFMGRTKWDHNIVKLYNPNCMYFHIDEVLRTEFYNQNIRIYKKMKTLNIVSTISASTYKGIDVIFKVSKLLTFLNFDFRWSIVGLNKNDVYVKYFSNKYNFDFDKTKIQFLGKKSSADLVKILQSGDVFIHPSYIDNSPNSVCEAQILGLPIIASNVGGLETLITNNINGFLVPINGIHEICHILIYQFNDEDKINDIKKNAQNTAIQRHNKEKILDEIVKSYKKIINNACC